MFEPIEINVPTNRVGGQVQQFINEGARKIQCAPHPHTQGMWIIRAS